MILVLVQQPRGVPHALFAGDYAKAKAWVREQAAVTGPVAMKFVKDQVV